MFYINMDYSQIPLRTIDNRNEICLGPNILGQILNLVVRVLQWKTKRLGLLGLTP